MLPWLIGGAVVAIATVVKAINSDDDSYEQSSSDDDRIEKEKEKQRRKITNKLKQYKKDAEKEMLDKYGAILNYPQYTNTPFWNIYHNTNTPYDKVTANSTKLDNLKQSIEQSELKTSDLKRLKKMLNKYINKEAKWDLKVFTNR